MAQAQHGVARRRIPHEFADIGLRRVFRLGCADLVDRHRTPGTRRILIRSQPGEAVLDLRIFLRNAGKLESVQDQPAGITIGRGDWSFDLDVREVAERPKAPAAAGLLFGEDLLNELILFLRRQ